MSDKLTRIGVPGARRGHGLMLWGEETAAEMVATFRRYADDLRAHVAAIDAVKDGDFEIEVVRGPHVQHHVKWVQGGAE